MLSILIFLLLLFSIYCAHEYVKGFRKALAKDGMTFGDLLAMRRQWIANGRPRPDKEGLAQRLQRINEIGNFAEAAARLQQANTYNARLRLALLAEQFQIGLQRM